MPTDAKTDAPETPAPSGRVEFAGEVLEQIRQHARSSMSAEICGILIGGSADGVTRVTARIAGEGADQGGAHVTFTQATWEHIYKIKDAEYPSQSIVGWYHSHPGFGIFLSDYDLFIHENFFNAPHQVAWVFDPHSDEEGCFGWIGKKVEPLDQIVVARKHRTPDAAQVTNEEASRKAVAPKVAVPPPEAAPPAPRRKRTALVAIFVLLAFAAGFAFPRVFPEWTQAVWSFVEGKGWIKPAPALGDGATEKQQDPNQRSIRLNPAVPAAADERNLK